MFNLNITDTVTSDLIFDNNTVNNQHPNVGLGGGITLAGGGAITAAPTITYEFDNNTFRGARGDAIIVAMQTGNGSASGRFEGNTFGVAGVDQSGSREAAAIEIRTVGRAAQTALINNNQIRQYGGNGILLQAGDQSVIGTSGPVGAFDMTVTNNTIEQPASTASNNTNGIDLYLGTTTDDSHQACVDILNNNAPNSGSELGTPSRDYQLRQRMETTLRLPGYGGANNDDAAVIAYIQGRNTGTESVFASNSVSTGGGYIGGAACSTPAP